MKKNEYYNIINNMKCQFENCKYKIMTMMIGECTTCSKEYCRKHRLPFDHKCDIEKIKEKHSTKISIDNPHISKDKMMFRI